MVSPQNAGAKRPSLCSLTENAGSNTYDSGNTWMNSATSSTYFKDCNAVAKYGRGNSYSITLSEKKKMQNCVSPDYALLKTRDPYC